MTSIPTNNKKNTLSTISTVEGISVLPTRVSVYGVIARYNAPKLTIENSNLSMANLLIKQLNLSISERYSGDGYYAHDVQPKDNSESYVLFADNEFYKNVMESVNDG